MLDPSKKNFDPRPSTRDSTNVKIDPLPFCQQSKEDELKALFDGDKILIGLDQLYSKLNPFPSGEENATVPQIENWNLAVLNHFRSLFKDTKPAVYDTGYSIAAQFSNERSQTTIWDDKYPGTCIRPDVEPHCGWDFVPTCDDQQPYLNGHDCVGSIGTEGQYPFPINLPWKYRLSWILGNNFAFEGCGWQCEGCGPFDPANPVTRHARQLLYSERIGMSWYINPNETWGRLLIKG
jgi:hypothetical protein